MPARPTLPGHPGVSRGRRHGPRWSWRRRAGAVVQTAPPRGRPRYYHRRQRRGVGGGRPLRRNRNRIMRLLRRPARPNVSPRPPLPPPAPPHRPDTRQTPPRRSLPVSAMDAEIDYRLAGEPGADRRGERGMPVLVLPLGGGGGRGGGGGQRRPARHERRGRGEPSRGSRPRGLTGLTSAARRAAGRSARGEDDQAEAGWLTG